ncbi:MAG TPA: amidohydrolase family protein, partial [Gemmatimonadaceae bacterium]|nr:amidohydrolase family protein [Gemmatimonadaceae bacterium]
MRPLTLRRGIAVLAAVLCAAPLPLLAQRRTPDVYAITNARIVPVSGPTLERGTIVVRNGLIAAVGANVAVPADARQIDGAGLTVYPGLIDAASTIGIPAPRPAAGGGPGGGGGSPGGGFGGGGAAAAAQLASMSSPGSTQRPGLQPEVVAADLLEAGGEQIDAARNAGITAALTAPRTGIFQGQSAFIMLGGEEPHEMIVRTPVALNVAFTPLPGGYPGSLMGVFSSLRQILLDAQHYAQIQAMYARDPRGIRRPAADKSLEALQPVLRREIPVIMFADQERQIRRALDLAAEFNVRVIIAGGTEAWKVADQLRAASVPVIATLNFPRRTSAPSADADPEPVRVLRERVEAPQNAAKLHQAGVRFAFTSGGLSNPADFRLNAARAVEAGLPAEQALRAMTIVPAELYGVANRLGTLEVGKVANLTVVRGDLFDREARLTHVFVDGRPTEVRAPAAGGQRGAGGGGPGAGRGAGAEARAASAEGSWSVEVTIAEQNVPITIQLQQSAEQLRGTIQGSFGSAEIADGRINPDDT